MSYMVNKEFSMGTMKPMKNNQGVVVEKYLPRKCGATSKLIGPKDHSSVQIFVPNVDENGKVCNDGFTVALSGYIRDKGRSDFELEKLLRQSERYPIENSD